MVSGIIKLAKIAGDTKNCVYEKVEICVEVELYSRIKLHFL